MLQILIEQEQRILRVIANDKRELAKLKSENASESRIESAERLLLWDQGRLFQVRLIKDQLS
jgi:hypothetical protein